MSTNTNEGLSLAEIAAKKKLDTANEVAALNTPDAAVIAQANTIAKNLSSFTSQGLSDSNLDDQNLSTSSSEKNTSLRPNLLNSFASYNPLITLQVTTPKLHALMVATQKYVPSDWTTICQSGGMGKAQLSTYFPTDLNIDNLDMKTISGQNQENRGSNATNISFDIIEPNGMSLVENLYDYCQSINEYNYCQLPYLLKISFVGYFDDGSLHTIPGTVKYIPIVLANMEIKANSSGATYRVTAIPINELSNTEAGGRIDSMVEISNSSTVQNYLNGLAFVLNQHQKQYVDTNTYSIPDNYEIICIPQISTELNGSSSNIDIGSSLFDNPVYTNTTAVPKDAKMTSGTTPIQVMANNIAYNLGQTNSIKTTSNTAVLNGKTITTNETATTSIGPGVTAVNQVYFNPDGTSSGHSIVRFGVGASILDSINTLIISSEYIVSQIKAFQKKTNDIIDMANTVSDDPTTNVGIKEAIKQLAAPFQWFMVTSETTLLGYDALRGKYALNYKYIVKPYIIDNAKIFEVPNQTPALRVVKEYDYILTGKNTEILNFDMDFKTAFLTYTQTANKDNKQQGTGASSPAESAPTQHGNYVIAQKGTAVNASRVLSAAPNSIKSTNVTADQTPEKTTASDIAATIYAPAEMLSIKLSVNGDPDYIKQDGIFLNPAANSTLVPYIEETSGSPAGIMFNSGEIYMNLNFLIPRDLNQTTGLIAPPVKTNNVVYHRNVFSGFFRVLVINNKINGGIFSQELECIRYDDSHEVELKNVKSEVPHVTPTYLQRSSSSVHITPEYLKRSVPTPTPTSTTGLGGGTNRINSFINNIIGGK